VMMTTPLVPFGEVATQAVGGQGPGPTGQFMNVSRFGPLGSSWKNLKASKSRREVRPSTSKKFDRSRASNGQVVL